jgi:cell wall-associated NlpC family hydrolase
MHGYASVHHWRALEGGGLEDMCGMTRSIEKGDSSMDKRAAQRSRCGSSSSTRGRMRRLKRLAQRQGNRLVTLAVACAVTVGTLAPRTSEASGQQQPQPAPAQTQPVTVSGGGNVIAEPLATAAPAHHTRLSRVSFARGSATRVTLDRLAVARASDPSSCRHVYPFGHQGQDSGAALVHTAERLVGCPYRFGGASSSEGFDCSGLVWYIHHVMHMPIPRRAEDQGLYAAEVPEGQLQPGDLLFFHFAEGDPRASNLDFAPSYINHVALYIGGGRFIHAPKSGKHVQYGRLEDFKPYFLKAGRYWSGSSLLARG